VNLFGGRPRLAIAVLGALAAMAVASIAWATIPGGDGVIQGCYSNRNGALRVIDADAGATCGKTETAIEWSQQGPPGLPGEQGPQGVPGIAEIRTVISPTVEVPAGGRAGVSADCNGLDEAAIGGGFEETSGAELSWAYSGPWPRGASPPLSWRVIAENPTLNTEAFEAHAVCARLGS
jgi:hypothetical protein